MGTECVYIVAVPSQGGLWFCRGGRESLPLIGWSRAAYLYKQLSQVDSSVLPSLPSVCVCLNKELLIVLRVSTPFFAHYLTVPILDK